MQAAMQGVTMEAMQDVGQWNHKASFLHYTDPDKLDAAMAERELHSVRKRQKCEKKDASLNGHRQVSTEESSSDSDGS